MKKFVVLFEAIILMFCFCLFAIFTSNRPIVLCVNSDGIAVLRIRSGLCHETITPYYCETDDTFVYFIPASVKCGQNLYVDSIGSTIIIDDKEVTCFSGFNWTDEKVHTMLLVDNTPINVRFMKSSDIPTLFISTDSGNVDKINTDETYSEDGKVTVLESNGKVSYKGRMSIKGRGNFTFWNFKKRPFHITLKDKASILGMEDERDWILLANSCDYSYMNNKLAFDMAKKATLDYTPDAEYADVYFNGEYWGLYLVAEKIKIGKNRVDITDLAKKNVVFDPDEPSDITGGYLMERDSRIPDEKRPPSYFITKDYETPIRIRSPKYASENEVEYISKHINGMENAISSLNGCSQDGKDWREYIDLESWVKYYIIAEIAYDMDIGKTSTFFYKDADSIDPLIHMGPCWDFDQAFGGEITHSSPEVLSKCPGTWFEWLYDKPEFYSEIQSTWDSCYSRYLSQEASGQIDKWKELIRNSVDMDNVRWDRNGGYGGTVDWPIGNGEYVYKYSFDDEVEYFKDWLQSRYQFLDNCWSDS